MRVCNLNSFSALIDRLIIENLKLFSFIEKNDEDKIKTQVEIITQLKKELDIVYVEIQENKYHSIKEERTYVRNQMFDNLFKLCLTNATIAKYDALKIKEASSDIIDVELLRQYINFVRGNLEERSVAKNNLDKMI